MTRLAFFLANLEGGGAERMMVYLATGLADASTSVDLVLARAVGPYLTEVPATVKVVDLASPSVSAAVPALRRYLRHARPDVLVATLRHVSVAAGLAHAVSLTKAPLVVREANTPSRRSLGRPSVKGRAVDLAMRWVYRRATAVLAVSEGVADDLVRTQGVPRAKVVTVYNPVVTTDVPARAAAPLGHPWFAGDGPPVVLGVGSLTPKKDFGTLIDAFARVRAQRPARLVILGEGPERRALERRAGETGFGADVELPGFVDNPFAFMARASVFVLSSVVEGLPGALIQALACGCPTVATDCPSGPYEVLEGGRYGRLVPMRDPDAMARAILATFDAPTDRDQLRRRGDDFAADRVVATHRRVLGAVAARRFTAGEGGSAHG